MKPTFTGEIQLAGWSESHNGGCKVTFWLQSPDELEAFRALTVRKGNTAGHRFMAALVEIGDDEKPIQYPPYAAIPADEYLKPKIGPLAYWAVMRCKEEEFFKFMQIAYEAYIGDLTSDDFATPEEFCKHAVMVLCKCDESRSEIDQDQEKTRLFHEYVRGPYAKYLAARGLA